VVVSDLVAREARKEKGIIWHSPQALPSSLQQFEEKNSALVKNKL